MPVQNSNKPRVKKNTNERVILKRNIKNHFLTFDRRNYFTTVTGGICTIVPSHHTFCMKIVNVKFKLSIIFY